MRFCVIVFITLSILTSGCQPDTNAKINGVNETFSLESFRDKATLKSSQLDLGTILSPVNIFFYDSLLFISSTGLDMNIEVYNVNNGYKKIGSIIPYGQGPDEMLSVARMDFNEDGSFWAHDVVSSQMKRYELTMNEDTLYALMKDFINPEGPVIEAIVIGSEKIVTTTHDINPLTRFYEYDMEGKRIATTGDYPSYERRIPSTATVEVFTGHATIHPKADKFLMAYEYVDLIEIYSADSKLKKRIQGPHNFLPDFELKERGGNPVMRRMYGKTKLAYIALASNETEIFLLYANGETRTQEEGEAGIHHNHIVSLDWTGKPVIFYELDHAVTTITVDWKKHTIYGLDRIESEVYSFKF